MSDPRAVCCLLFVLSGIGHARVPDESTVYDAKRVLNGSSQENPKVLESAGLSSSAPTDTPAPGVGPGPATGEGGLGKELSLIETLKPKVLIAQYGSLALADLSLSRLPDLHISPALDIYSVDFHWNKKFVFFAANASIYRAKLERRSSLKDLKPIVTEDVGRNVRLAVDWVKDRIYWMSDDHQSLEVADLDGNNRDVLFDSLGKFFYPNNLAIDPYSNKLFIVSNFTVVSVDLAQEDLKVQPLKLVGVNAGQRDRGVRALALDRGRRHVYLTGQSFPDQETGVRPVFLTRVTYEGRPVDVELMTEEQGKTWNDIFSMDLLADTLYFAHYKPNISTPDSLWKKHLAENGSNATKLYVPRNANVDVIWGIKVFHPCVQRPSSDASCSF